MNEFTLSGAPIMTFLASAKPDEAKQFYSEALGLIFIEDNGFSLIFVLAGGIELRVQKVDEVKPQIPTILGWQVPDVEAAVTALSERGVQFEQIGIPGQDERGIWTTPGGTKIAWFKDPDGNTLSLTQTTTRTP